MIDSLTLSLFSWMLDDRSFSSLACTSTQVDRIATELSQKNSFWCQRVQALLGRSTMPTMKESNWKSIYHALSLCTLGDELGLHQRVFTHLTVVVLLSERWQFSKNMLTSSQQEGPCSSICSLWPALQGHLKWSPSFSLP